MRFCKIWFYKEFHREILYCNNPSVFCHNDDSQQKKYSKELTTSALTHWGRVMHIFISNLTIIGSDNGLSPARCQAIIWTNAGILLTGHLGTNFSETLIEFVAFSLKKMSLKVPSAKWRPFCLGLNVLIWHYVSGLLKNLWKHWQC